MNFSFDEQQRSLAETVASVLADVPALTAPDLAAAGDDIAWSSLAELGLFALQVPEADGGVGLTLVDVALAAEALGAGLAPPAIASTLIAIDLIASHGSDRQRDEWLSRIAAGECRVAIAMYEAGGDYDLADLATVVRGGRMQGDKLMVAGAEQADLFIVVARDGNDAGAYLVANGVDGVSVEPHDTLDPSAGLARVRLADVALGNDALLGGGNPRAALDRLFDVGAIVHAGLSIGIAGRMLDRTVDYAKTREQFGRPIGSFQTIKHRCADMAVAVEAGRSVAYYAFWAAAEDDADRSRAASMAKAYCGDVARFVCNEAIQVHGGMGFTWELGLHRYLRRAKLIEHQFGDTVYHQERVLVETLAHGDQSLAPRRDAA